MAKETQQIELRYKGGKEVKYEELKQGNLVYVGNKYKWEMGPTPNLSSRPPEKSRSFSSFYIGVLKYCKFVQELGKKPAKSKPKPDLKKLLKKIDNPDYDGNKYDVVLSPALFFEETEKGFGDDYKVSFLETVETVEDVELVRPVMIVEIYKQAPELLRKLGLEEKIAAHINGQFVELKKLE